MAYVLLTADAFRVMFPEFATLTDPVIEGALSEASREVDESWIEADFQRAHGLYTAHLLKTSGGAGGLGGVSGLSSVSIGPMSFQFAQPKSGQTTADWLAGTSYGARFASLRRKNHPPVVVI